MNRVYETKIKELEETIEHYEYEIENYRKQISRLEEISDKKAAEILRLHGVCREYSEEIADLKEKLAQKEKESGGVRRYTVDEKDAEFFNSFYGNLSPEEIEKSQGNGMTGKELYILHYEWSVEEKTGEGFDEWLKEHFIEL